ncbi:hypothetical protein FB558_3999 [Pseudonocardia kunmingensis]|uniref:Uncharacterized protein n=1 Tax=Pseudonocardia kunmingensis TaxID=630975 RepID=A0A543DQ31_9PSEU|nr:hypothetical protein FB558_3999 [Pseudonocardia kunmingensis]
MTANEIILGDVTVTRIKEWAGFSHIASHSA